jgi:hypothetical protein
VTLLTDGENNYYRPSRKIEQKAKKCKMTRVGFEPTTSRLPVTTRSVNPRGVGKSTTAGEPKVKILDI